MAILKLRHVDHFRDRHGTVRYYFRRTGGPRTALPGQPGSEEFMTAYAAALANSAPPKPLPMTRAPRDSFNWLIHSYYTTTEFKRLRASTKAVYRGAIERFASKYGALPVAKMRRQDVQAILSTMSATPAAANMTLKMIRVLMRRAFDLGLRETDPTLKLRKLSGGEWRSWSDVEIAAFESRWPIGSRERLAFALHLYTGQRRSDVCRMTWRDITGPTISVVQQKTGAKLTLPLHSELQRVLRLTQRDHVRFSRRHSVSPSRWQATGIGCTIRS
jgi:integrase